MARRRAASPAARDRAHDELTDRTHLSNGVVPEQNGVVSESEPAPAEDVGGDPVCWLHLVCPECGGLAEEQPPAQCPRCGAEIPGED